MRAIYKKELKSYFTSAIAWVFLAFFFFMTELRSFLFSQGVWAIFLPVIKKYSISAGYFQRKKHDAAV